MQDLPQSLEQAHALIRELEETVALMKRQMADETAEKYAAYARIVELRRQLEQRRRHGFLK